MGRTGKQLRNDPDRRMSNIVTGAGFSDEAFVFIDLSRLDREPFPWYIEELRKAEAKTRRLRGQLEAILADSERRCPVCDAAVTGRADQRFCGATCRQRARRANLR